jgi:DNA-binding MarR family transcriptional regulator
VVFSLSKERTRFAMSIAHDDEQAYRYELKINQYEMERMWWEDLMQNSWLSPGHKIVLYAIRQIIHTLRIDDSVPTTMHLTELANKTGLSKAQIKRLTSELYEWGFITKNTKQRKEGKQWISEMTIGLGGQIRHNPKGLTTPDRNHGGPRKQKCHNCGSENVEPVVYQCLDCGHHGSFD